MSYYSKPKSTALLDRQAVEDLVSLLRQLDAKIDKLSEVVLGMDEDIQDIYDEILPETDPEPGVDINELMKTQSSLEIEPDQQLEDDVESVDPDDPSIYQKP